MTPTTTNWHSIRTISFIFLTFIVAGLTAIHGQTPFDSTIDVLMPIILFIEHVAQGNTGTATQ